MGAGRRSGASVAAVALLLGVASAPAGAALRVDTGAAISVNRQRIDEITVPILLVFGDKDAGFSDPRAAGEQQRAAYTGSSDVSLQFVPNAGHAITLERAAPTLRSIAHEWLESRGY
jgi:pimeloyl-ACP methyl ester carboxylesterase